jgi:hypothetical protein
MLARSIKPLVCGLPNCILASVAILNRLLPFIGHMGITNSEGVIFDFAGPYTINKDDMAFGSPTRYVINE